MSGSKYHERERLRDEITKMENKKYVNQSFVKLY